MPLAGRQITLKQALALCYRVGWRGHYLTQAVAVMCAESARYTDAYHDNMNGSQDRGLFQINSIHEHMSTFDPLPNAEGAYRLWQIANGFTPWFAYDNGSHRKFVPLVLAAKLLNWKHLVPDIEFRIAGW